MKTTSFHISFLVFSIFINSFSCSGAQVLESVLDTAGNPLSANSSYYIYPYIWGPLGGGVTAASIGSETCPLAVVQEWFDVLYGRPLKFTSVNPNEEVIHVCTDLNIEFVGEVKCQSNVWKVDEYDDSTGHYFLTTDGVKGNPGADTITNWFRIEKSPSYYYKLVYCPKVCEFCQPICSDVGSVIEHGYRRLALSDSALGVVFEKAS